MGITSRAVIKLSQLFCSENRKSPTFKHIEDPKMYAKSADFLLLVLL